MAFDIQTFKTRTLTAIVFAVVMLSGLFINQWTFLVLFSIIHFGCWIEYFKLIGLINPNYFQINPIHKNGLMLLGWAFMLWMTSYTYQIGTVELKGMGWLLMMILSVILLSTEIVFQQKLNIKVVVYSVFGLIYISLSWGLMINLRSSILLYHQHFILHDAGMIIPCVIIFSIWINDTMAYIVGSLIGKTPLSKVSPKKTWEGTIGGIILSVVVMGLLFYLFAKNIDLRVLIIAFISAVAGTFGDLLESKLKRLANVKDSGSLMPGHGGFLDRFDSLLLATPFVWLYVHLLS